MDMDGGGPHEREITREAQVGGRGISARVAAVDGAAEDREAHDNQKADIHGHDNEAVLIKEPLWKRFLAHVGPGFLVSLAYLDPANMETDFQAGASYGYELLWVILIGLIFALIIQSLAANLGVVTGKHLAEVCRAEYPRIVRYCLWLLAEVAVIAADIPEVIGTAFALNILFHIPVWAGVLISGCSTLLLLALQRYGVRKLEFVITMLVFIMAACFFGEMSYVKPPAVEVIKGLFIPRLHGNGAVSTAISLLGALVMPHNLFLHSALVLSRKTPPSVRGIKDACRFFLIETGFALFISLLINIAMVSVSGKICGANDLSSENVDICNNFTLENAPFLLRNVLGKSSKVLYGIALLASGQSSTITGTYAGQFVMQGFLEIRIKQWKRNLLTRTIAILPSLIVSIIGGSHAAGQLIIIASMILSFELPFALLPLLKFSSSENKLGCHKTSIIPIIVSWVLGFMVIGINVYFLSTSFVTWLIHSSLRTFAKVLVGLVVFPLMAIYVLGMLYLAIRKDTAVTFGGSDKFAIEMEKGRGHDCKEDDDRVPYREDLAGIPLPD